MEKDEKVVCVAQHSRQRLIMHYLKVDQAHTIGSPIVNNIVQMRIAVRPPIFELGTPEPVCPAKLSPGGFERIGRNRAVFQLLTYMHSGNCIHETAWRTTV